MHELALTNFHCMKLMYPPILHIVPGPLFEPNVLPVDSTSTSLQVTWNAPQDPNGVIIQYTINFTVLSIHGTLELVGNALESCAIGEIVQNITVAGNATNVFLYNLSKFNSVSVNIIIYESI